MKFKTTLKGLFGVKLNLETYGFDSDEEVEIEIKSNEIVITPVEKKKVYYSRIKGWYYEEECIRLSWNKTNESARFEELEHITVEGTGGYDMKLYYDHKVNEYLMFDVDNWQGSHWHGHIITPDEYNKLSNGDLIPFDLIDFRMFGAVIY